MLAPASFSGWAAASSTAAGSVAGALTRPKGKIVQGVIDLTFHHVAGAVLRAVLHEEGYEVEVVSLPHEAMYKEQEAGKIDIMLGWLEGSHGVYLDKYRERALVLNRVYEPYCYWGVPDYVPESEVAEIADLAKPEVASTFEKRIQGITPGAGISHFSREAVQRYGLALQGFDFFTCVDSPRECFDAYEDAVAAGKRVVIPHYHPQYLHAKYKIRQLADPLDLMRGAVKDDCSPIVLRSSLASGRLQSGTLSVLRRLYLGNDAVSQMDYYMCVEGMSADAAAARWMAENPEVVAGWRSADAYAPAARLAQLGYELPTSTASCSSVGDSDSLAETSLAMPSLAIPIYESTSVARRQYEATVQMMRACLAAVGIMQAHAEAKGWSLATVQVTHLHVYLKLDPAEANMDADAVLDRGTDLLRDVFGSKGGHSRTAMRVSSLPHGVLVGVRIMFQL